MPAIERQAILAMLQGMKRTMTNQTRKFKAIAFG